MSETVTRLRATASTDGYDDTGTDWTSPSELVLTPFGVEPVSSTEDNDNRQAVISGYRLYFLNSWPDIQPGDRVLCRDKTWHVNGLPAEWRGPSLGGMTVALSSTTG